MFTKLLSAPKNQPTTFIHIHFRPLYLKSTNLMLYTDEKERTSAPEHSTKLNSRLDPAWLVQSEWLKLTALHSFSAVYIKWGYTGWPIWIWRNVTCYEKDNNNWNMPHVLNMFIRQRNLLYSPRHEMDKTCACCSVMSSHTASRKFNSCMNGTIRRVILRDNCPITVRCMC